VRQLVILTGPAKGTRVRLDRESYGIGRERSNEVRLDDGNASRRHAEVFRSGDTYRIRDLESTNGTFVNGRSVTEAELRPGDRISIGDTVLLYDERKTKGPTRSVAFREEKPEQDTSVVQLDPRKSQYLDPRAVIERPAAAERLAKLYGLISELTPILSAERILSEVLTRVMDAVGVDRAFMMLLDEEGKLRPAELRLRDPGGTPEEINVSRRMTERALETGESILSSDTLHDQRFMDSVAFTESRVSSFVCAPLKSSDRVLGLLYADTVGQTPPLAEDDLEFLSGVALLAGTLYANALHYGDLLDSMEETQSILRCLRSGIVVTDNAGKVMQVNEAACSLLGLREEELVGRPLAAFRNLAPLWRIVDETGRSGIPGERQEIVVTVGGESVPVGVSTSLLRSGEGSVRGVVTNFRSLRVIKKLSEQVRMSQHLAALGEMAAGVAHEIRNPLNSIRGFAQLLEEQLSEELEGERKESASGYTGIIIEEVDRMNQLVQDLLDFSRSAELTMMEMDAGALLDGVLAELGPETKANGITVEKTIEPDLPPVYGNADKLKQVLFNVVRNGVQAMTPPAAPEGRRRLLAASARALTTEGSPLSVEIVVSDTGVGMDDETLQRAFDPFFTTRERGTGLGLAICRKIMQQHGGTIEAESRLGAGTTLRLKLPLA
jgi:PAS domain S-box-containing protein